MRSVNCPMVSIIMPVYNAMEFLKDSIGDILAQSFGDFELICIDDGSTDDSGAILDKYAETDPRICVLHKENGGGGAARNCGIKEATGEYLLFLDADDRFESDLLECSVSEANRNSSEVLVFNADTFDYETGIRRNAPWLIKENTLDISNPFKTVNNTVWNKLFLRSFVERMNLSFTERRAGYSTSFVAISLMNAERIGLINKVLLHYRTNNPNSNLSNEDRDPTAIFLAMKELKDSLKRTGQFSEKRRIYEYVCVNELLSRLRILKTLEGYSELYNTLHKGGIEELELLTNNDKCLDTVMESIFREIKEKNLETYLYDNIKSIRKAGLLGIESRILSLEQYPNARNIAIYGGGDVGKDFFMQVLRRPELKAVCWVDRNYEKLGYPVQSPEVLKETDFDVVIIAVADKRAADAIKRTLLDMNIHEEKIVWDEYTQII